MVNTKSATGSKMKSPWLPLRWFIASPDHICPIWRRATTPEVVARRFLGKRWQGDDRMGKGSKHLLRALSFGTPYGI